MQIRWIYNISRSVHASLADGRTGVVVQLVLSRFHVIGVMI